MSDEKSDVNESRSVLEGFSLRPKHFGGREITVSFTNNKPFMRSPAGLCDVFGLEVGNTVNAHLAVKPGDGSFCVYIEGQNAEEILNRPKDEVVAAKVRTLFGIRAEVKYGSDGAVEERWIVIGLLVTKLL